MRTKGATRALVLVGVALRVWQYAADQSMWFDELSIARNILGRSLSELVRAPLGFEQIAPIGYVALVKISALVFGPSDLALRLPSFLAGIAALLLFWRLAESTLDGIGVPLAVGLFATTIPMVRYTAELKQYGFDVAAAVLLTLVALDLMRRDATVRQCVVAGVVGLVLVWFSQTAVFVLAGLGLVLVWRARRPALVAVPIWACAALSATVVSMRRVPPETLAFMHRFWTSRDGFFPASPRVSDALWLWDRVVQFFGRGFSWYAWPGVFAVAICVGFVVLWRRRRDVAALLLGPIVITVIAACVRQYPFWNRTVLFLEPAFLLAIAAGVGSLGTAFVLAFAVLPVLTLVRIPPPYFLEGFKPVLAYVQTHRHAGDAVYVYANAYEAIDHYGPRYGLPAGSYVLGVCDQTDDRPFLEQVDRFRGTPRLWVIGSSVPEFQYDRDLIDHYLGAIGLRRDSIVVRSPLVPQFGPVSAELFDLSDTTRLRSVTLATFQPPPPPNPARRRPICNDWVRP